MNAYFIEQYSAHPAMQPQDVIKLCYQAVFGAEHLLADRPAAWKIFEEEFDSADSVDGLLTEPVSPLFSRVNLRVWKFRGYPKEQLFDRFVLTASEHHGSEQQFRLLLEETLQTASACMPAPEAGRLAAFSGEYLKNGIRPVHHSGEYRRIYRPSYRLVRSVLIEEGL